MFIYSETINLFVQKQKNALAEIASNYHYGVPKIIVYHAEDDSLGKYFSDQNLIGLNKLLLFEKQEVVDVVLKHEYAHYLVDQMYGSKAAAHGKEFKKICAQIGIKELDKESLESLHTKLETPIAQEALINKVKKLFKLSSSSNKNEAEQATLKANQLLLKYNLTQDHIKDAEEIYMLPVLKAKRSDTKIKMIGALLKKFNVYPVSCRMDQGVELQISGTMTNVKISEYVTDYFITVIDLEWKKLKSQGYKGVRAKNSLIRGLISGFISKQEQVQNSVNSEFKAELVVYQAELRVRLKTPYTLNLSLLPILLLVGLIGMFIIQLFSAAKKLRLTLRLRIVRI